MIVEIGFALFISSCSAPNPGNSCDFRPAGENIYESKSACMTSEQSRRVPAVFFIDCFPVYRDINEVSEIGQSGR